MMAGVALYPTGKHSEYPGIPIPVTSVNKSENNDTFLVVDKLKSDGVRLDFSRTDPGEEKSENPAIPVETTLSNNVEGAKNLDDATAQILDKKIEEKTNESVTIAEPTVVKTDIPEHVPYLLIGAGTASFAAYRAIKSRDPTAKILIVGEENRLPYMRPPLSKELWYPPLEESNGKNEDTEIKKTASTVAMDDVELRFRQWNGRERSLYYEPEQFYIPVSKLAERDKGGISVLRGRRAERIDVENQVAFLDDGTRISYDKCLIATG